MSRQTALYDKHVQSGAKIIVFAGWQMPIHYGSQIEEHHRVRNDAGMFDVSHMTVLDLEGKSVKPFLRYLLANDVARLSQVGKAMYTCMLNQQGGVIDDLIVYFLREEHYRLVVNAATRDKDIAWIETHADHFDVTVNLRDDLAMIAVQGPNARVKTLSVLPLAAQQKANTLSRFECTMSCDWFIARTGYTGEDGFEIVLPGGAAPDFWDALIAAGVSPVGLGARDTLRLEAGMNLYGADMDEGTSPLISGLGWTVAWEPEDRDFIGREAITREKTSGPTQKLVGLVLEDKGVLRSHQRVVVENLGEGEITSGSFSPTLGKSIALARVPIGTAHHVQVEVRNKRLSARVVKFPFVKNGKICV